MDRFRVPGDGRLQGAEPLIGPRAGVYCPLCGKVSPSIDALRIHLGRIEHLPTRAARVVLNGLRWGLSL